MGIAKLSSIAAIVLVSGTTLIAQTINKVWQLEKMEASDNVQIEGFGNEFRTLDFTQDDVVSFSGRTASETGAVHYQLDGNSIQLFDNNGKPLELNFGTGKIQLRIERLTSDALILALSLDNPGALPQSLTLSYRVKE